MNSEHEYDLIVVGTGFAGLSLADAAIEAGKRCLITDRREVGGGASGAPGVLANPASGRRARMTWKAEECLNDLESFINRIETHTGKQLAERRGIFRPALTEKIAADFRKSPTKYEWPEQWLHWMDKGDTDQSYPFLGTHYGGLRIVKGISLKGDIFCKLAADSLQKRGCTVITGSESVLKRRTSDWKLQIGSFEATTSVVVDCTGYAQTANEWWSWIPLHPVKGQAALFRFPFNLPFRESLSSLGYMATIPGSLNELTVGSTYEHQYDHLEPDQEGLTYLKKKLNQTLPGYAEQIEEVTQWASCRVSTPDKLPVIGEHPEQKGLYIFGGLGSKGLLMSPLLGKHLIRNLFYREPLHPNLSISRFI